MTTSAPQGSPTYAPEAFDLKGNPSVDRDWWRTKHKSTAEEYNFTVAHWALTEGRFRKHLKAISEEEAARLTSLDDMLLLVGQDDVVQRRVFQPGHRACVPNFGVTIKTEVAGKFRYYAVSRQMVLFAVERRKAWRMLQSKAGVVNKDYLAQKAILDKLDHGQLTLDEVRARARELFEAERAAR
jgi:pyruvate-ferredoxin/flavodoxin oxidoreductase